MLACYQVRPPDLDLRKTQAASASTLGRVQGCGVSKVRVIGNGKLSIGRAANGPIQQGERPCKLVHATAW